MADEPSPFAEARGQIGDLIARLTKLGGQIADIEQRERQVVLATAANEAKAAYLGRLIRETQQHGPPAGPAPIDVESK
jgi:hypothetical protein